MRHEHLRRLGLVAALAFAAAGSGCASMNHTEKGAAVGGTGGAIVGTAIAAATGADPLTGAVIGGGLGAAGGALAGNGVDKQERRDRDVAQAAALEDARSAQQRMGVFDVIRLAQDGQPDTIIINQIRNTGSTFTLTGSDLSELKRAGVSPNVIAEMQAARPAAPRRVVVREQPAVIYDSPPVFVRPAPTPIIVVGPRPYCHPHPYHYHHGRHW